MTMTKKEMIKARLAQMNNSELKDTAIMAAIPTKREAVQHGAIGAVTGVVSALCGGGVVSDVLMGLGGAAASYLVTTGVKAAPVVQEMMDRKKAESKKEDEAAAAVLTTLSEMANAAKKAMEDALKKNDEEDAAAENAVAEADGIEAAQEEVVPVVVIANCPRCGADIIDDDEPCPSCGFNPACRVMS